MVDVQSLCEDGYKLATEAVRYDQAGDVEQAIFFYSEASDALLKALSSDSGLNIRPKVETYIARAEELYQHKGEKAKGLTNDIIITFCCFDIAILTRRFF